MKLFLLLCGALVAATSAFVSFTPVVSPAALYAPTVTCPLSTPACGMSMTLGGGGRRGRRTSSSPSTFRSIFTGKGKSGGFRGGNTGGNNNDGGGKLPPLGASASDSDSGKGDGNVLSKAWGSYNGALEKNPLITKAFTSMIGFALGDLLAQKFIDKSETIDLERLLRLASFGFLIHGPTGHFFYNFLDAKIPGVAPLTVAAKVAIDQLLWNPIFGCMFFGYMGLTAGSTPPEVVDRIKNNLWASVKGSWTVWPVAHAINFRFIPTSQRLLYINSVQIFYNCFLSILAKNSDKKAAAAKV